MMETGDGDRGERGERGMTNDQRESDPLATIKVLKNLSAEERRRLSRNCVRMKFAPNQIIFDKDDDNCDVMFVTRGKVAVTGYSLSGKRISFDELSEGDFFGELAAIDGELRSASISAVTPSELAVLSPNHFQRLLVDHPDIALRVMRRMAEVIRKSNERIMDFATLSAQQRVCSEIVKMAEPDAAVPGAWSIYPLPTQGAIASRIDTSRETVARVMRALIKGGVVVRKGRAMFIPDKKRLEVLTNRLIDAP